MSSWDRVRFIPWSRIDDVSGQNFEQEKERVFRSLQREATKQKVEIEANKATGGVKNNDKSSSNEFIPPEVLDQKGSSIVKSTIEFTGVDLMRSLAFGGCIGSITGAVFGFMDGMRSAAESSVLKNASNVAKSKYLIQGTTRTGAMFGVFFSGFHALKYGIRVLANEPGDAYEISGASVLSLGAMMSQSVTRAKLPYGAMLIAMDTFSTYMKDD